MTPEEAIKTIQVAIAEVEWNYPMDYSVAFETAIEALENVNRQQAAIERLKKIIAEEEEKYKLCAKRFYKVGVKEFAERLKKESYPFPCAIGVENAVTIRTIDDLAKEMVGDTE